MGYLTMNLLIIDLIILLIFIKDFIKYSLM
jgi:hypothetical protein